MVQLKNKENLQLQEDGNPGDEEANQRFPER
jgi:hypothetical protein